MVSMGELLEALRTDFQGREELHQVLLNKRHGNGWAGELMRRGGYHVQFNVVSAEA